jgi:hypothetical protein
MFLLSEFNVNTLEKMVKSIISLELAVESLAELWKILLEIQLKMLIQKHI